MMDLLHCVNVLVASCRVLELFTSYFTCMQQTQMSKDCSLNEKNNNNNNLGLSCSSSGADV